MRFLTLLLFIAFFAVVSLAQDAEDYGEDSDYIPDSTPSSSGNELPSKAKRQEAGHKNPFRHMKCSVLGNIHSLSKAYGTPYDDISHEKGSGSSGKPNNDPYEKKLKAVHKHEKGGGGVPADVIATGPPAAAAVASKNAKPWKGGGGGGKGVH